jgi:hypothetical protein
MSKRVYYLKTYSRLYFPLLCVFLNQQYTFILLLSFPNLPDRSVGVEIGYGLEDQGIVVRFPVGAAERLLQRVRTVSGALPAY